MKTEILYGIHPVCEALNAGKRKFFKIYTAADSKRFEDIEKKAGIMGIPVEKTSAANIESLALSDKPQGIAAAVSAYETADFYSIIEKIAKNKRAGFVVLLDRIVDPQNLGTVIRTGFCAGIDCAVIPKDRSASPTAAVSKVSAGALEHINLCIVTNITEAISLLKKNGFWIFGMEKDARQSVFSTDFKGNVGLVIGGEEKGIRHLVKKNCDFLISIPQTGKIDSLNASVSAGIVMYEVFRQRKAG